MEEITITRTTIKRQMVIRAQGREPDTKMISWTVETPEEYMNLRRSIGIFTEAMIRLVRENSPAMMYQ